jgi:hypothetical protein
LILAVLLAIVGIGGWVYIQNALANMGLAHKKLGALTEARRLWQEALAIYQAIESPEARKVQGWLAACAEEQRG